MRKAFVVASMLLLVAFAFQFVFAAVGAFTKPAGGDGSYVLHSVNGMAVIPALTLVTTLLAVLARAPGKVVGLAILPLGLVVAQVLLAALAGGLTDDAGATTPIGLIVGGLHAVNGIIAVHVVVGVVRAARRLADPAAGPVAELAASSGDGPASGLAASSGDGPASGLAASSGDGPASGVVRGVQP